MARPQRRRGGARARAELLGRAARVVVPAHADVVVAGGGASGLAAAIAAARDGARVVVLERAPECGRTILATGAGRCNLMNASLVATDGAGPDWSRYNEPGLVRATCGDGFGADVLAFLADCGLAVAQEDRGRMYPVSRQASSVRNVLLARARALGVTLACAREARSARGAAGSWDVRFDGLFDGGGEGRVRCGALVVACGGASGLARSAGVDCAPVLCSLACDAPAGVDLGLLDGRRAHVEARLLRGGAEVARDHGEVVFRPYGISGIVTFDLSRLAEPGDVVALDLVPGTTPERARELERAAGGCDGLLDPLVARPAARREVEGRDRARPGDARRRTREGARPRDAGSAGQGRHARLRRGRGRGRCLRGLQPRVGVEERTGRGRGRRAGDEGRTGCLRQRESGSRWTAWTAATAPSSRPAGARWPSGCASRPASCATSSAGAAPSTRASARTCTSSSRCARASRAARRPSAGSSRAWPRTGPTAA